MKAIVNKNILVYLSVFTFLTGCNKDDGPPPAAPDGSGWQEDLSIAVDGTNRDYFLYLPENANNAPVVFLLHGNGSNNSQLMGFEFSGQRAPYKVWETIATTENLILVVPNGTETNGNPRGWNDCRNDANGNPNSNDVLFISSIIDRTIEDYNANASRIFAVGTSNGGHMAMRLAEEIPNKLSGFASIVSSRAENSQCTDSTIPISALFMNGTADTINPFEGGPMAGDRGDVFSAQETVAYWIDRNQTDTTPVVTNFEDTDTSDNCTATKRLYQNGTNNTEVAFYEITGGGHSEPSILERYRTFGLLDVLKEQNGDIEMAEEVWNFFKNK